jgi:mannose-6-phosphate isomerase-like protein (cupin superfamily)
MAKEQVGVIVECTSADIKALEIANVSPDELSDDGEDWLWKTVQKPWGYEVEIFRSGIVSISRLVLNPGAETSMHCHTNKNALLLVEQGECILETLSESKTLREGQMTLINRGAFHRTRTLKGATLIEVESPANKRDLVRINDRYGRTGMGY